MATNHNFRIKNGLHVQGGTATFHSVNNNSDLVVGGVISGHGSDDPARITTSPTGQLYLDSTSGQDLYLNWWNSSTSNIITESKIRSPGFYDRNNTNYYVNPASDSVLNNLSMLGTNTKLPGHAYSNTHDNTNTYWHIGLGNESTNHVLNLRVFNSSNSYVNHRFMATGADIVGNLNVTGNLTVTGSIDRNSVTDLDVVDKTITVGVGQSDANSGGSGLIVAGSGAQLLWDYGDNRWEMNENFYITGHVTSGSHMSSNIFYNTGDYRTLNTAGNGWDTVIARNSGSPYADMKHSYRMNGTTLINSSRQLRSINAIYNTSDVQVMDLGNTTYTILKDPEGSVRLYLGDTGDAGNYYDNTTHNFRNRAAAAQAQISDGGFNLQNTTATYKVQGTTVIDESRNISAGTVSGSSISTNGARQVKLLNGAITMKGDGGGWAFGLHALGSSNTNHGGFGFLGGVDALSYYYIGETYNSATNFRFYKSGQLTVGGTTILDSSQNLSNIGTINSGAITSTGASQLFVGSDAVTVDNSGLTLTVTGTYSDGRYEHRFRKRDEGGGIPLYVDTTGSTANSHSQIARFGSYTSNTDEFEVYGTMSADGYRINNASVIDASRNITATTGNFTELVSTQSSHNYLRVRSSGAGEAMIRYGNTVSADWYVGLRNGTSNSITNTGYHIYSATAGATVGGWNADRNFYTSNNATIAGSITAPKITATGTGMSEFATNLSNNEDWINSPISIRERGLAGVGDGENKDAPNINYHWAGRLSKSIWMESTGRFHIGEYSSTGVPQLTGMSALNVGSIDINNVAVIDGSRNITMGHSLTVAGDGGANYTANHIKFMSHNTARGAGHFMMDDAGANTWYTGTAYADGFNNWGVHYKAANEDEETAHTQRRVLTVGKTGNLTAAGALYFNTELHGSGKKIFTTGDSYLRINQSSEFGAGIWMGTSSLMTSSGYIAAGSNGGTTTSRVYIKSGGYNGTNVINLDGTDGSIYAAGKVIIGSGGTTTYNANLQVAGDITTTVNGNAYQLYYTESRDFITHSGATAIIKQIDNDATNAKINFNAWDNSTIMTVMNSGNVGIGVADPANKLQVAAGNNNIQAWFGDDSYTRGAIRVGGANAAGGRIYIEYNGDSSYIDSYGGHGSTQRYRDLYIRARNTRIYGSGGSGIVVDASGNVIIGQSAVSYTQNDNGGLTGNTSGNKLHVNGSIQLTSNSDGIVFGRGTSTFLKDEELGFGWAGGWYMTEGTYLRSRNNKIIYSTGSVDAASFRDSGNTAFYVDPASASILNTVKATTHYLANPIYGMGITNLSSARFDTVDSGNSNDPLELTYYNGTGVIVGPPSGGKYLTVKGTMDVTDYGCFGQTISAMSNALKLEVNGDMSIRNGGYLYQGISTNEVGSWKTRIGNANSSTFLIHAQGLSVNNTGYGSVTFLTANASGVDAHVFRDINDTNYYLNPAEASNLKGARISGMRTNYASSSEWTIRTQSTNYGAYGGDFGLNGDGNQVVYANVPSPHSNYARGKVWQTRNNDANENGADGGWNKDITGLNVNKAYMSVVYVKRSSSSTNGSFYHGCRGSSTDTHNLNGTGNSNPYFSSFGIGTLTQDVWYVSIGFIQAANDSNTSNWTDGGLWNLKTGVREVGYTTFKMGSNGAGVQTHRTYLYYSTDSAAALDWYKPGFYEVNGEEPSVSELLMRPSADTHQLSASSNIRAPIFYDSDSSAYYIDPASSTIAGSARFRNGLAFDREGDTGGAGDFSTYIDATNYPPAGYGSNNQRYWMHIKSKGGTHIVLNSDGGNSGSENSMDHFSIFEGGISSYAMRKFYVTNVGNVHAKGNITAYQTSNMSDIRLKKDIKPLEGSLEKVLGLQGVSFKWKESGKEAIGFIAQDVEKIEPILVNETNEISTNELMKTVDYSTTVALLVEAIKELKAEVDELKKQLITED